MYSIFSLSGVSTAHLTIECKDHLTAKILLRIVPRISTAGEISLRTKMPLGWKSRGTHILMRQLVRENRAQLSTPNFTIRRLLDLDDGVFRNIIKFI